MPNTITVPQLLTQVEEYVMIRVAEINAYHEGRPAEEITVEALDDLVVDSLELKSFVDLLGGISTKINKAIQRHQSRAGTYLAALGREDYDSPDGVIERKREWHVGMPPDEESKMELFEYLKEKEIFEQYATVNSKSLNSLFMAEWEAAKKKDPLMEVLFSMPGVPEPQINEYTTIKAPRGKRSKRKDPENE